MKTLIKPEAKLNVVSLNKQTFLFTEKLNNSKIRIGLKFYQKLFAVLLTSSIFLIFHESPKDLENLCNKYHSEKICSVW